MDYGIQERRDPVYLLTIGYVLALIIIGVMSVCIHFVIGQVVQEQNNAAVVVSARQAKLSQKVALYATQYVQYKDPVFKEQLSESLNVMRHSHAALTQGDRGLAIPSQLSPSLERIYFHKPFSLDENVKSFLEKADTFLAKDSVALSTDDTDYKYIVDRARGPLLQGLEAAMLEYEAESQTRIGKLQSYQKMALCVIFATLLAEAFLIFRPLVRRVHRYADKLRQMAMTDVLTGVDNSRSFMRKSMKEIKSSKRHGQPLSIAILDIDNFKNVNDQHGHIAGDTVLKTFAQFVQRSMRIEDEFARIGGEEFVLLLPHTPLVGAKVIAERIRKVIEISPVRLDNGEDIHITVSIGIAEVDPDTPDFQIAMDAADKALYRAKEEGRNKVVCSDLFVSDNVIDIEDVDDEDEIEEKTASGKAS